MVKISSLEVYSDRYGTQVPESNVSYPGGYPEAPVDYYSYTEDGTGLDSLQQGEVQDRPSDEDLMPQGDMGFGDSGEDPVAALGKQVSELRNEMEDKDQSADLSDADLQKFLDRVASLEKQVLSGAVSVDFLQNKLATLRDDWENAVLQAKEKASAAEGTDSNSSPSKPRVVDEKTHTATYDSDPTVTVRADYDDKVTTNEITAGNVTLQGATLNDSFVVTFDEDTKTYIITSQGKNAKGRDSSEEFHVTDAQLSSLTIVSGQVDVSALNDEQLGKLHIGLDPKPAREAIPVEWPTDGIADLISMKGANSTTTEDDNSDYAVRLAKWIDQAVAGKMSWNDVKSKITTWYGNGGIGGDGVTGYNAEKCIDDENYMNDVIRKVITAVYHASKATSKDDPRFLKMMAKMPQDFRLVLKDWVTKETGELREMQGGDMWNSGDTADVIQASIDWENGKQPDDKPTTPPSTDSGKQDGQQSQESKN